MKRFLSVLLAVALTLALFLQPVGAQEVPQEAYDGYLVRLTSDGAVRLMSEPDYQAVSDSFALVEELGDAQALVEQGAAEYYEPNYILSLQETYVPTQWNLKMVNAQAAWEHVDEEGAFDMRGNGVTVAVVDSGLYTAHADLDEQRILPTYNLSGAAGGMDGWHGTFVAGVIAAQVNNGIGVDGVAPEVTLLPICVTRGDNADIATVIKGIDYAVEQGVDVINLSLGGKSQSTALQEACQRALEANILVVAAAGNYKAGEIKSQSNYMYPASCEGVISVSACKQQSGSDELFDGDYSYFNDRVTVSAPGTAVQSLYTDGGIATKNGTSFATPVVAAMAAMAKERNKAIGQETFEALLRQSAVDLGAPGVDIYYGEGLIDIKAFAELLDKAYTITYQSGEDAAVFPSDTEAPMSFTLASEELLLPEPVLEWHEFLGWYENAAFTGEPVTSLPSGSLGNKTYYARWQKEEPRSLSGTLELEPEGPVEQSGNLTLKADSRINGEPVVADSADYTLQWLRSNEPITDATGVAYTVTQADRGEMLSLRASAKGEAYTGTLLTQEIGVNTAAPTLSFSAEAGNGVVNLNWRVSDNGGSAVTGFTLYQNGEQDLPLAAEISGYAFSGLVNGTEYTFRLEAHNTTLTGEAQSGAAQLTATPTAPPDSGSTGDSGGGGGGSGGGGGAAPVEKKPPEFTAKADGEEAVLEVSAAKDMSLQESSLPELVEVDLSRWGGVNTLRIPKALAAVFGAAASEKSGGFRGLSLALAHGLSLTFDSAAIGELTAQEGELKLGAFPIKEENLNTEQQHTLKGWRTAGLYKLTAGLPGGRECTELEEGTVNVRLRVDSRDAKQYSVLLLIPNGGEEKVETRLVTEGEQTYLEFATSRFSCYALVSGTWQAPFTDVREGDWFYSQVKYVYQSRLMNGIAEGRFAPGDTTDRAMAVTTLWRLFGAPENGTPASFDDIAEGQWYAEAAAWAHEGGVAEGGADGYFYSDAEVTREQFAAMLQRCAALMGGEISGETTDLSSYTDVEDISGYALSAMKWAVGKGILGGRDGGVLAPGGMVTRAELAVMLERFAGIV